jgi:hypothetical protein
MVRRRDLSGEGEATSAPDALRSWRSAALAAAGLLLATSSLAAQPYPLDPADFQVNVLTIGLQRPLGVVRAPGGGFDVIWSNSDAPQPGARRGIFSRWFGADGSPRSGDFQVNTVTSNIWYNGGAVGDREGNFVVIWESHGSSGGDPDWSVQARRLRADGTPLDAAEFQVNTYTTSNQEHPRAAFDDQGNFVVVWTSRGSFGSDTSAQSVQARRFHADGSPIDAAEFQVNTFTPGEQSYPDVASTPGGDFVVVWYSYYSPVGAGLDNVLARRFASDGTPLDATEFQVHAYTTSIQDAPDVVAAPNGDFLVAWESFGSPTSPSGWTVQSRRFDRNGVPLDATDVQANTGTLGGRGWPQVAMDAEGNFVVAWDGNDPYGTDLNESIQARRYRAGGTPVDAHEMQLNTYTTGFQDFPVISMGADGDFVVAWESYGSPGTDQDLTSVLARRFGRPTIPVTSTSGGIGGPGCTLRDAITAANTSLPMGDCPAGNEGANLDLPAGSPIALTEADNGSNGLPLIERPVTILGHGSRIERDPGLACPVGPEFRLFEVPDGGVLTLEDVSISNGCLSSGAGAGVLASGGTVVLRKASIEGNEAGSDGGGVAVVGGSLFAYDSTIRGNLAGGAGGGLSVSGDPGLLLLARGTISENVAATGGGLSLSSAMPALVRNATFSGNEAGASGGGIELAGVSPAMTLDFSTIVGNASPTGAGTLVGSGVLSIHGSLVGEGSGGTDCASGAGGVVATGANLDTDGSCAALAGGNVTTVASLGLGSLADNGGWVRTHLPLPGSPVLDVAPACATASGAPILLDARGYPRPTDDDGNGTPACDLGAVERGTIFLDGFESGDTGRWILGHR